MVSGNPILLQIYAVDFIQTHANLEFDRCILTRVEKNIIFVEDYYMKSHDVIFETRSIWTLIPLRA